MPFIFSTLARDVAYTDYRIKDDHTRIVTRRVVIKGGHGVAQAKTLLTPFGVRTEVSDEDLAFIEKNSVFQLHVKNGFVTVENKKALASKVAKDMVAKEPSSPLTPDDFKPPKDEEGLKIHSVGKPK